jgi:Domain of unknown function (DUF4136)
MRCLNAGFSALVACALLMLAGCATTDSVTAQVSSAGQWPDATSAKTYAFERLPSQQAQADLQARVEAAAKPVLAQHGFVLLADGQPDVWVQVAAGSNSRTGRADDEFPAMDGRIFGGIFGGHGGVSLGMRLAPTHTTMQVDVLLRDRRSGKILYETHASYERTGGQDEQLLSPLFDAALKDFPTPAISPRQVTVQRRPLVVAPSF